MIQNYKFGIDVDGTLTYSGQIMHNNCSKEYHDDLNKLIEQTRFLPIKKGVDVLSSLDLNITIITGRGHLFREVTEYWLNNNCINYRELVTIENYKDNKFDFGVYLKYKLNAYLSRGIHFALDDDESVVKMLNNYGVKAVRVDDDFEVAFNKLFK